MLNLTVILGSIVVLIMSIPLLYIVITLISEIRKPTPEVEEET